MNTFTIDINNRVAARDADVTVPDDTVKFASAVELADVTKDWPTTRLVELWNKLPNVTPVTKFTDRKTAIRRIWIAIANIAPDADREPAVKPKAAAKKKPAAKAKAVAKAKPAAKAADGLTKTDQVVAALREPNGATLKQLMALTGWQAHSVRGFLSAQVSKRMGLRVKSIERDGVGVYRVPSLAKALNVER
jgi:Protein of unknown function (DUF3489)